MLILNAHRLGIRCWLFYLILALGGHDFWQVLVFLIFKEKVLSFEPAQLGTFVFLGLEGADVLLCGSNCFDFVSYIGPSI